MWKIKWLNFSPELQNQSGDQPCILPFPHSRSAAVLAQPLKQIQPVRKPCWSKPYHSGTESRFTRRKKRKIRDALTTLCCLAVCMTKTSWQVQGLENCSHGQLLSNFEPNLLSIKQKPCLVLSSRVKHSKYFMVMSVWFCIPLNIFCSHVSSDFAFHSEYFIITPNPSFLTLPQNNLSKVLDSKYNHTMWKIFWVESKIYSDMTAKYFEWNPISFLTWAQNILSGI